MAEETKLTLKAGVVITAIASLLVFLGSALLNHERRVTILETTNQTVISLLTEIRSDMKSHLEKEKR